MTKSSHNLVGATGEYFVCAELGKRGILALLTPGNNPLFDIMAVSPDAEKSVAIQVKTMSLGNNEGWRFGKDICESKQNPNLFIVLVNLKHEEVEYYIYKYDELAERIQKLYDDYMSTPVSTGTNKGKTKVDVDFRWFNIKNFKNDDHNRKNNWNLLGF